MALKVLSDVKLLKLPRHDRPDGELFVFEQRSGLPFMVSRVFMVRAARNAVRGQHAHRQCSQVFLCPNGAIEVECDDGGAKQKFELNGPDFALFVPASIWATETYRADSSMLTVLCDRPYDEADYIRDYPSFLAWRQEHPAQ